MLPKGKVWETALLIRVKAYTGSNFLTPSSDKTDTLSLRRSLVLFVPFMSMKGRERIYGPGRRASMVGQPSHEAPAPYTSPLIPSHGPVGYCPLPSSFQALNLFKKKIPLIVTSKLVYTYGCFCAHMKAHTCTCVWDRGEGEGGATFIPLPVSEPHTRPIKSESLGVEPVHLLC